MRSFVAALAVTALVACGGADEAADMPEMAEDAAPAGPTLADFDGTWDLVATLEGTADPVAVQITGSAGDGWTMTLPDRDPMPVTTMLSGDSLVMEAGPYESVIRESVMVSVRNALVLTADGRMVGTVVATYQTPEGEEVVPGTVTGARGGM